MEQIRIVQFDIHGTNPVNRFVGEEIPILDKTCEWVIPNGSPFFSEDLTTFLYDEKGAKMTKGRDWDYEGEFDPFCAVTGRSISSFIWLSDDIRKNNKKVSIDYQSLGAYFIPRNSMDEWLKAMHSGNHPIPYSKVLKVPDTLPSSWHLHSIKTEIRDWYELAWFFKYLSQIQASQDTSQNDRATTAVEAAFKKLRSVRDTLLPKLKAHDRNTSNPHGDDKFSIVLGNLDNLATATKAEDMAGVRNDVISTPLGLQELARTLQPDTSGAMRSGILPLSRLGGETFIPPTISGSFEGMGQINEVAGLCLEPDGKVLMMLSNHRDGRTEGLYFTTATDYNKDTIKIAYTNYRYEPPVLKAQGITVDRIVSGSGNKLILVGVGGTNNWYVALTNGTFDPGGHSFVKCDVSAIVADLGSPWNTYDNAQIHLMGEWIVLAQTYLDSESLARTRFYKVATGDVRDGKPVTWQRMTMSYQNWEGAQISSAEFKAINTTRDANNFITRMGPFNPTRAFQGLSLMRRLLNLSAFKEGSNGIYYWHMSAYYHMSLQQAPYFITTAGTVEMIYELNPANGQMALSYKTPAITVDQLTTTYVSNDLNHMDNSMVSYTAPASVVLNTGEIVSSVIYEGQASFPSILKVIKLAGRNTPQQVIANPWSTKFQGLERVAATQPLIETPTLNGTSPSGLSYEADGEIFSATDQRTLQRAMFFRQVSGGYQVREGVNNLKLGNVNSRPLTTAIYLANLLTYDGTISITGSAADLAAGGVECGSNSLSVFGYTSTYPENWVPLQQELRGPAVSGIPYTFPRTYSRTLDQINKRANYKAETYYGMRQNILDKLKAYVAPNAQWTVTWNHLGNEMGGMFNNLNLSLVTVTWNDPATQKSRTQLLLLRPVLEAPNASHPNVYLITDYTVLDAPSNYRQWRGVWQSTLPGFYPAPPFPVKACCVIYKNGNSLKIHMQAAYMLVTAEQGYSSISTVVDLDLSTNKFSALFAGCTYGPIGDFATMIPKVGMTDIVTRGNAPETLDLDSPTPGKYDNTGTAAAIYHVGSAQYLTMSVYPETGWLLFIQEGVRVIFNGTVYKLPGGTFDLRDVDPAPQNKTFYVYATIEDDAPKWVISSTLLRKTGTMLKGATLVTNDKQLLTITRHQPFMIGEYTLSYTREGGTIPLSAGFPQDEGDFYFIRQGELLA